MYIVRKSDLIFITVLALLSGTATSVIGFQVLPWGAWIGGLPTLLVLGYGLRRPLRRWRISRLPFPEAWREWLNKHVEVYRKTGAAKRLLYERDIQFILHEWTFEGIDDVKVNETLMFYFAAGAALLLHGRPDWELPYRHTILFYPAPFNEDYLSVEDADFDGMAHSHGPIIVTRGAVEKAWKIGSRRGNVILHELAHLFDFDQVGADGVPSLMDPRSKKAWKKLMEKEMHRIRSGKSMLRSYGATHPTEFFAVSVETFFGDARTMSSSLPELYEALSAFFNLDPASDV